jgi:phosphoribosylformylglycinamidine (FGAM) synthase-like amidotransferase family enzyme
LRVAGGECVFLSGLDRLYLPVAHAEGKFVPRSAEILERLDGNSQLVLRYARPENSAAVANGVDTFVPYPENPNGSAANVAGVCDESGRVFGLMPHPERHIDPTHHPRWTRLAPREKGDGLAVFANAVGYFR